MSALAILKNLERYKNLFVFLFLIILVLGALYYRVLFAYNINYTGMHNGTGFGHDEYNYIEMAKNIVDNRMYSYMSDSEPNAYVTPGYPLFLALVYYIKGGGNWVLSAKLTQAFISALSIVPVFFIGRKLHGKTSGLIAASLMAFYPPLVMYSRFLLTETLYIFMFLCYFLMQILAFEKQKGIWHVCTGMLAAATVLVRPLIVILLPLAYIYMYFTKREGRAVWRRFGFFLIGFFLVMAPWWIRNIVVLEKIILLCTQSNPFYYGIIENHAELPPSENETIDGIKLIWNMLKEHPIRTIKWYTVGKLNIIFAGQDYWLPEGWRYLNSLQLLHPFIIVTGGLGITMALFKEKIRFVSIFIVLNIISQLLFIPVARYAVPIIPLLCICSSYMLCHFYREKKYLPQ